MPITNYEQYMGEVLSKGKIASYQDYEADSGAASAVIEWGKAIKYDAANPNRLQTYNGTGKFVGVAIANHYGSIEGAAAVGTYAVNDAVSYLRRGQIYVQVLEDVVKGDDAKIDNTTGNFRPGGTATGTVSGVVGTFKTAATAGNLAKIEINLP